MSTPFLSILFLFGLLLLASVGHAQTRFSYGPSLGLHVSQAAYRLEGHAVRTTPKLGWAAGITTHVASCHWGLQPALLYSSQGFVVDDIRTYSRPNLPTATNYRYYNIRLDYLSLPLTVLYTQQADGQGWQLSAGGYVAAPLRGHHRAKGTQTDPARQLDVTYAYEGDVKAQAENAGGRDFYARCLDAGLHAGVGYTYGATQLQLRYSLGLADGGSVNNSSPLPAPSLKNRGVQLLLSYFIGERNKP